MKKITAVFVAASLIAMMSAAANAGPKFGGGSGSFTGMSSGSGR